LFQLIHLFSRFGSTLIQQNMNVSTILLTGIISIALFSCANVNEEATNDGVSIENIEGNWQFHKSTVTINESGVTQLRPTGYNDRDLVIITHDSISFLEYPFYVQHESTIDLDEDSIRYSGFYGNETARGYRLQNDTLQLFQDNGTAYTTYYYVRSTFSDSIVSRLKHQKVNWNYFRNPYVRPDFDVMVEHGYGVNFPERIDLTQIDRYTTSFDTLFYFSEADTISMIFYTMDTGDPITGDKLLLTDKKNEFYSEVFYVKENE
jgi:hypothetical protein